MVCAPMHESASTFAFYVIIGTMEFSLADVALVLVPVDGKFRGGYPAWQPNDVRNTK